MTAEVAILNRSGVALAADSAVTTGFPGQEKIFTTANKIFALSKVEPVGIMINGHVEHFGCPWEVIIKDFRAQLASQHFPTLEEYVERFGQTICDPRFRTLDGQAVTVITMALSALGELERRIFHDDHKTWRKEDIRNALDEMANDAQELDIIDGFEGIKLKEFAIEYGGIIDDLLTENAADTGHKLPSSCRSAFRNAVLSALTHKMQTGFSTGIVVAGYGREAFYPQVFEITVDGGFMGKVRYYRSGEHDVEKSKDGSIITTFAQDDIVNSFLNGIDKRFEIFNIGLFSHLTELLVDEVLRVNTAFTQEERAIALKLVRKQMSESFDTFRSEIGEFAQKEFRKPVLDVLRTAPKEMLAELAESLVSITSLRQRVSGELETVGGPVDVALISKGEGLIWIKRKHYFDTELNPHYQRNYFREVDRWPDHQ